MATASKTYETVFAIKAKYEGGPAFQALNRDISQTEKHAHESGGKMAAAVAAGVTVAHAAMRAVEYTWEKTKQFMEHAYEAALEQKKVHDVVQQAYGKLVAQGRLRAEDLDKQIEKTHELSEEMRKQGGVSAEILDTAQAGLSKFYSSDQIEHMMKGYQDWLVTIAKGEPHMENVAELQKKIALWIMAGKGRVLTETGMSKEDLDAINKRLKALPASQRALERAAIAMKHFGKETGATARWLQTDAGVAFETAERYKQLERTVGGPLIGVQREYNQTLGEVYSKLQPVADLIAKELQPRLADLVHWLHAHQDDIASWAKFAADEFFKLYDELMVSIHDTAAQWAVVWPVIKEGWNLILKSIDDTKTQWVSFVSWIDDNVIKPIYLKFKWLVDKLAELWAPVSKFFSAVTGQTTPTIANPSGGYTNVGGGGVNTYGSGGYGVAGQGVAVDSSGNAIPQASASGSLVPDADIAAERKKLVDELSADPALEKRFAAIISKEQGTGSGRADVMEATMNRALSRGQTMHQALGDKFFGPQNRGEVDAALRAGLSQKVLDDYAKAKADVGAGRNRLRGMTDQGMANEIHSAERLQSEGEHYGLFGTPAEKASAAYRHGHGEGPSLNGNVKDIDAAKKASSGPNGDTNVSMNPNITIHGVPAGQEGAVAGQVKRAMEDPNRRLLSQLKNARDHEARLGYV
jgi:hypothetical protein